MPLPLKPHTATIRDRTNEVGLDGAIVGTSFDTGAVRNVKGHLVRLSGAQSIQVYGIESDSMGRWLQDIEPGFEVGDIFSVNDEKWIVRSEATVRDAEPLTAHIEYQVERHKDGS